MGAKLLTSGENNKSHDGEGYINEIFKRDVIGYDLKKSLLEMFNKLKQKKDIGSFMKSSIVKSLKSTQSSLVELLLFSL